MVLLNFQSSWTQVLYEKSICIYDLKSTRTEGICNVMAPNLTECYTIQECYLSIKGSFSNT